MPSSSSAAHSELDDPWSWLASAIERTYHQNEDLWRFKVGERARVAQIFLQLRYLVPDRWNVDCEYNRHGENDPKRQSDTQGRARRYGTPDLIIHRRGVKQGAAGNLLVVELKTDRSNLNARSHDYRKVQYWMNRIEYQYGAVVSLGENLTDFAPKVLWFDHRLPLPRSATPLRVLTQ